VRHTSSRGVVDVDKIRSRFTGLCPNDILSIALSMVSIALLLSEHMVNPSFVALSARIFRSLTDYTSLPLNDENWRQYFEA
jgi:hypothetical protein